MNLLMKYVNTIKSINKKLYLTPIPILMVFMTIWSYWSQWQQSGEYYDFGVIKYILMFPFVHWLLILCVLCYPHANIWIQSTWLYKKTFRESSFFNQSGSIFLRLLDIETYTPDQYVVKTQSIQGADGYVYTGKYIGEHHRGKRYKARNKQINVIAIFIIKDILLRYLAHGGIFMISPLLFLIAVPSLDKKGYLKSLGK